MMSYFKVGEEVILQSQCYPELNNDCVVIGVFKPDGGLTMLPDGTGELRDCYSYTTTIEAPSGNDWCESALRKKHKPSTESLSTMIEELNKVKA
jgi:hypothetical protein